MAESILRKQVNGFAAVRFLLAAFGPLAFLLVALILGLAFGAVSVAPLEILQIILHRIGLYSGPVTWALSTENIIWEIRLPEVLAAALVGVSLALAGALFQAVLRNPLADPYVIGTSAGAQLGVTIAFLSPLSFSLLGFGTLQIGAFTGALATVLFVYFLARTGGRTPVITLILAGFVVSSFLISATTFLTYAGDRVGSRLTDVLNWTLGGVQVDSWGQLAVATPAILGGVAVAFLLAPRLNLILLGEDQASHLGLRVEWLKVEAIILASLLTGLAVTLAGVVAFVGLVVPHTVRLLYGPGHRLLIPVSAVVGAGFVVLCDMIARVVISEVVVPLGVVTAVVGAPLFLHLLRRSKRVYAL